MSRILKAVFEESKQTLFVGRITMNEKNSWNTITGIIRSEDLREKYGQWEDWSRAEKRWKCRTVVKQKYIQLRIYGYILACLSIF